VRLADRGLILDADIDERRDERERRSRLEIEFGAEVRPALAPLDGPDEAERSLSVGRDILLVERDAGVHGHDARAMARSRRANELDAGAAGELERATHRDVGLLVDLPLRSRPRGACELDLW